MSKVLYNKLNIKSTEPKVNNVLFNDVEIEVLTYLPIEKKLELISDVLTLAADDNNFYSPTKLSMLLDLECIFYYSNIKFTDKQKENLPKLYDNLKIAGLIDKIIQTIPEEEYEQLISDVLETAQAIYDYRNSALGILDSISADYSGLQLDAKEIGKELSGEKLNLLKDVLTKLG